MIDYRKYYSTEVVDQYIDNLSFNNEKHRRMLRGINYGYNTADLFYYLKREFDECSFLDIITNKKKIDSLIELLNICINIIILEDKTFNNSIQYKKYFFFGDKKYLKDKEFILNKLRNNITIGLNQQKFILKLLNNTRTSKDVVDKFKKMKENNYKSIKINLEIFKRNIYKNYKIKKENLLAILKIHNKFFLNNNWFIENFQIKR